MNASGFIEPSEEAVSKPEFVSRTSGAPLPVTVSRYRRLTESRSITPSPTPLLPDTDIDGGFKVSKCPIHVTILTNNGMLVVYMHTTY